MSKLFVDDIVEKTSGHGVQIADLVPNAGSVAQVQRYQDASAGSGTSTSTSYVDDGVSISIICLKAPGNHPASIRFSIFSICLWEVPKLLISMISRFLNVSLSPKTNYFIFGDTGAPKKKFRNSLEHF